MKKDDCVMQLINGNGEFDASELDIFAKKVKLDSCAVSCTIVSIMGPQSGGKSTLLNYLFHTKFREMDSYDRRRQTTKGVWVAKCVGIEPCTIAMDLEGNDSEERGPNDTSFEKQIVLFALAISDIVLINMCCKEIGREHAANKPLLRTVFRVMMQIFGAGRKKTLLFVIRDKSKTPVNHLKDQLLDNIQKIWDEVPKPAARKGTQLNDIFMVEVVALSNYLYEEDKFTGEVAQLRHRFSKSISSGGIAAGDRKGGIPGSGFSCSSQEIWKQIKENEELNLNLPSHEVMVANIVCEKKAKEKFNQLISSEDWLKLVEAVKKGPPVKGLGKRLSSILDTYLSEYDMEAECYDKGVRDSKRHDLLEQKAFDFVLPAYTTMLCRLHSKTLENCKVALEQSLNNSGEGFTSSVRTCINSSMLEFDQECKETAMQRANWDSSSTRDKLLLDIDACASKVKVLSIKLSELKINSEKQLFKSIAASAQRLLEDGGQDTWIKIRKLLNHEPEVAVTKLLTAIAGFQLEKVTIDNMVQKLRVYARNVVEQQAIREADDVKVLSDMKDRFEHVFKKGSNPKFWKGKENIRKHSEDARKNCLKLLSVRAAICLDAEDPNSIENDLISSLMSETGDSTNAITSSDWQEVSSKDTLITPQHCEKLWRKFEENTKEYVKEATSELKSYRKKKILSAALVVTKLTFALGSIAAGNFGALLLAA